MIADRLGLDGGEPLRATWLPFHRPRIEEDEIAEVVDTLRGGWLTTGPRTKRFEREFTEYVGAKYGVAVNSATAAMHLALEADRHQAGRRGDRAGLHVHGHGRGRALLRGDGR